MLIIFSVICVLFICKYAYTGIQKMYFIFAVVGITIYSGLSTTYIGLCDKYFIPYIVFLLIFTLSYLIGIHLKLRFTKGRIKAFWVKENTDKGKSEKTIQIHNSVLIIFLVAFFLYYFVQLIYPDFRLFDLFSINLSVDNIFERRSALRGNLIYQLFYYVNLMSAVFVFVYAYRKFKEKKWWIPILIFAAWYYCQAVTLGYMSRNEFMIIGAFIVIILCNHNSDDISISFRLICIGLVAVIALIPFLNAYEMIRMGVTARHMSLGDSMSALLAKETNYGKYYEFCSKHFQMSTFLKYMIWLVTLPIPSAIAGELKNFGLETNTFFTVLYTGINPGEAHYSVILPSIFGEALLIYGKYFFWIHAVFLGFFISKFCVNMEKNKELILLNVYFAVNMFILGRGGSEAVIATMVNYMVMYWIVMKIFFSNGKRRL